MTKPVPRVGVPVLALAGCGSSNKSTTATGTEAAPTAAVAAHLRASIKAKG
jgi:hypothetical protein